MKTILLSLLVFFSSSGFAHEHSDLIHLKFHQGELHAHITWELGPLLGEESIFRIEFKTPKHESTEISEKLKVSLKMPEMDHGSAPTAIQRVLDEQGEIVPGVYRISNIYFSMSGTWLVSVSLKNEIQTFAVHLGSGEDHAHH